MITPELLGYIKGELAKGRSREDINKTLIAGGGWTEEDLSDTFREIIPMGNVAPKETPAMASTLNKTQPISIVPPLSSPKPFVSSVFPPSSMSSSPVTPAPSFKPPVAAAPAVSSFSTPSVNSPMTPPVTRITPTFTLPVSPVTSTFTPPVTPAPSITPPSTFASSFTPPVQQPAPKSTFSFSAPSYTSPVSAPQPTFVASSLKQAVISNPPPKPPSRMLHLLLRFLIILIVLVGVGFGIYFFRLQIINLWNSSSIGANLRIPV